MGGMEEYVPLLSTDEIEALRVWHEAAYEELTAVGPTEVQAYGLVLGAPPGVFPPSSRSDYSDAVLAEVRPDDRVLDMGTGSGIQALLAATVSTRVLGVDRDPAAVATAEANAQRNGLDTRARFQVSDLFAAAEGEFDLIVFDPPFRWFRPRDQIDATMTDEKYRTLTRFVREVRGHLASGGRLLLNFGTSADLAYLYQLLNKQGLDHEVVAETTTTRGAHTVTYFVIRATDPAAR